MKEVDVGGKATKLALLLVVLFTSSLVHADDPGLSSVNVDILRYDISVDVNPDTHSFHAIASMDVTAEETIDEILFAFSKDLLIEQVTVDGMATKFTHKDDELLISLGVGVKGVESIRIVVEYDGITGPEEGGFRWSYVGDITYMIYESMWYPTIHEVRAPARLEIIVPEGYSAISSGDFVGIEEHGEKRVYVWEDVEPAYGISFAAGEYRIKVTELVVGDVPVVVNGPSSLIRNPTEYVYRRYGEDSKVVQISCYLLEEDFYLADECLRASKNTLEFYTSKFSGYPYNRFSVVEMPDQFFGGHGDQGFILLQADLLRQGSEEFLAHEIAHNWWGALISAEGGYNLMPFFGVQIETSSEPSNNHWLNEGFATYSSMMYLEDKYGEERMLQSLRSKRREYFQVDSDVPISLIGEDYGSPDYHAIVYSKGAFVLHMLRHVVGEEGFNNIMDTYIQQFKGKSANIEAFEEVSEGVYGESLGWFFDSWIRSNALPDYAVGSVSVEPCKGGYCTNVEVLQKGDLVNMPLDVSIITGRGRDTKRLWMDGEKGYLNFVSASKPAVVELDHDYWILESERTNNIKVLNYLSFEGLRALFDSILNSAG